MQQLVINNHNYLSTLYYTTLYDRANTDDLQNESHNKSLKRQNRKRKFVDRGKYSMKTIEVWLMKIMGGFQIFALILIC